MLGGFREFRVRGLGLRTWSGAPGDWVGLRLLNSCCRAFIEGLERQTPEPRGLKFVFVVMPYGFRR